MSEPMYESEPISEREKELEMQGFDKYVHSLTKKAEMGDALRAIALHLEKGDDADAIVEAIGDLNETVKQLGAAIIVALGMIATTLAKTAQPKE